MATFRLTQNGWTTFTRLSRQRETFPCKNRFFFSSFSAGRLSLPLAQDFSSSHPSGQKSSSSSSLSSSSNNKNPTIPAVTQNAYQQQSKLQTGMTLWTSDGHLQYCFNNRVTLDVFQSLTFTIHPAALEDTNVRLVLCSHEGEVGSPLALNTFTALSVGSLALGNLEKSRIYFHQARMQLEYLFDTPNYAVAEGLCGLVYLCTVFGEMDKCMYYALMAREICKQIGATNSAVYTMTVLIEFGYPTSTLKERRRILHEYTMATKGTAYYDTFHEPKQVANRQLVDQCCRVLIFSFATFQTVEMLGTPDPGSQEWHEQQGMLLRLSQKITEWQRTIAQVEGHTSIKIAQRIRLWGLALLAECSRRLGYTDDAVRWADFTTILGLPYFELQPNSSRCE